MKKVVSILILGCFFVTSILGPNPAYAEEFRLPAPGVMVPLSPEFNPPILKGIKVHPDNPFRFDFILDQGDSNVIPAKAGIQNQEQLKTESTRLIKYFLASLTIPEKDLWVNLSPYEKDRIVPSSFGQTEMGRDLLAEDYMLKQITASLIYPENNTGKIFWKRIYEEAAKRYGTTNIPVNTFNKVWILPEKAKVYENAKAGTAYIVESKLKVMLEEDYLALSKHSESTSASLNSFHSIGANIVREIIIPELTKEVNEDKNFTQLRQVYNSLILAVWYKNKIKDSILAEVYANKNKINGLSFPNASIGNPQYIYQQYLQAFKKGVYDYIKDEPDPVTWENIPRKYFSGGVSIYQISQAMVTTSDQNTVTFAASQNIVQVSADMAMSPKDNSGVFKPDIAVEARRKGELKILVESKAPITKEELYELLISHKEFAHETLMNVVNDLRRDKRFKDHPKIKKEIDYEFIKSRRVKLLEILGRLQKPVTQKELFELLKVEEGFTNVRAGDVRNDILYFKELEMDLNNLSIKKLSPRMLKIRRAKALEILNRMEKPVTTEQLTELLKKEDGFSQVKLGVVKRDVAGDKNIRKHPQLFLQTRDLKFMEKRQSKELKILVKSKEPITVNQLFRLLINENEFKEVTLQDVRNDVYKRFRNQPNIIIETPDYDATDARRSKELEILDGQTAAITPRQLFELLKIGTGFSNTKESDVRHDVSRDKRLSSHPKLSVRTSNFLNRFNRVRLDMERWAKNKGLDVLSLDEKTALAKELEDFFQGHGLLGMLENQGLYGAVMYMVDDCGSLGFTVKNRSRLSLLFVVSDNTSPRDFDQFRLELTNMMGGRGVAAIDSENGISVINIGKNHHFKNASESMEDFFQILKRYQITGNPEQGVAQIRFVRDSPLNRKLLIPLNDGLLVFEQNKGSVREMSIQSNEQEIRDYYTNSIRVQKKDLDSAMKTQEGQEFNWQMLEKEGYSIETHYDYTDKNSPEVLEVTLKQNGRLIKTAFILFNIFPQQRIARIQLFFPDFPKEAVGRARALLIHILNPKRYAGFHVLANASAPFRNSLAKIKNFQIEERKENLGLENREEFRSIFASSSFKNLTLDQQSWLRKIIKYSNVHGIVPVEKSSTGQEAGKIKVESGLVMQDLAMKVKEFTRADIRKAMDEIWWHKPGLWITTRDKELLFIQMPGILFDLQNVLTPKKVDQIQLYHTVRGRAKKRKGRAIEIVRNFNSTGDGFGWKNRVEIYEDGKSVWTWTKNDQSDLTITARGRMINYQQYLQMEGVIHKYIIAGNLSAMRERIQGVGSNNPKNVWGYIFDLTAYLMKIDLIQQNIHGSVVLIKNPMAISNVQLSDKVASNAVINLPTLEQSEKIVDGILSRIPGMPAADVSVMNNWTPSRFDKKQLEFRVMLLWKARGGANIITIQIDPKRNLITRLHIEGTTENIDRQIRGNLILRILLWCRGMLPDEKSKELILDTYLIKNTKANEFFKEIFNNWRQLGIDIAGSKVYKTKSGSRVRIEIGKFKLPDTFDMAMSQESRLMNSKKGGIDFTPSKMNLQTQNTGEAIRFHLDPAMLQQLQNAPGFVPVIINIQPMTDLRGFLGINDPVSVDKSA